MREFLIWEGTKLSMAGAGWYTSHLGGVEKKVQGLSAVHDIIRENQPEVLDLFYSGKNKEYHLYWQGQSSYDDA
jgi:hypothetical protein